MTEEEQEEEKVEEEVLEPLKVEIIEKEKIIINPTSEDTIDIYDVKVTDEEIKEMQDAQ